MRFEDLAVGDTVTLTTNLSPGHEWRLTSTIALIRPNKPNFDPDGKFGPWIKLSGDRDWHSSGWARIVEWKEGIHGASQRRLQADPGWPEATNKKSSKKTVAR